MLTAVRVRGVRTIRGGRLPEGVHHQRARLFDVRCSNARLLTNSAGAIQLIGTTGVAHMNTQNRTYQYNSDPNKFYYLLVTT